MNKGIVLILVLLLLPVAFAAGNVVLLSDQDVVLSDSWVRSDSGYVLSDDVLLVERSWWQRFVIWLKGVVGVQSVQGLVEAEPEEVDKSLSDIGAYQKQGYVAGVILRETRSPVFLSEDNPRASEIDAETTEIEYYDHETDKILRSTVYNDFDFNGVPPAFGGGKKSIPDTGTEGSVMYDKRKGYLVKEGSEFVFYKYNLGHVASGPDHEKKDYFDTNYDIYVDREGFGVEFADKRNMAVLSGEKLKIPLKFTNKVAEGIDCGVEVKVKKVGFYTEDLVFFVPWQKCKLGVNDLVLELDRDELGTYEIKILGILRSPSFEFFKKMSSSHRCDSSRGNCGYKVGNQTIIDNFPVLKKIEIVSQSVVDGMSKDMEVFKTIQ